MKDILTFDTPKVR